MSTDTRLRELERRWKETAAPEDEVAYLVERVRVGEQLDWESYKRLAELNVEAAAEYLGARVERGDLTQEKLELAAYCGEAGATEAIGSATSSSESDLARFLCGVSRWGRKAFIRGALAASRRCLEIQEERSGWVAMGSDGQVRLDPVGGSFEADGESLLEARAEIEVAEAFVCCPCSAHLFSVVDTTHRVYPPLSSSQAMLQLLVSTPEQQPEILSRLACDYVGTEQADELLEAVRRSLLQWAIGDLDPAKPPRLPRPEIILVTEWVNRGWDTPAIESFERHPRLEDIQALGPTPSLDAIRALDVELWKRRQWLRPLEDRLPDVTSSRRP